MVEKYRRLLEQRKGAYLQQKNTVVHIKQLIKTLKKESKDVQTAQTNIQMVAEKTQKQLIFQLTEIVDLALSSIYKEHYEFKIDFVQKRGKTEAEIYFLKNSKRRKFLKGSGGGVADVASFALRLALWSLKKTEKTIILDEPFKYLDKKRQEKAGEMLILLSNELGIQFIVVSHEDAIINTADKVFKVNIEKDVSIVEEGV